MMAHLILLASVLASPEIVERIDVAPVWSGHPVGFALLTHGDRQFVAYYDAERRMTVASRRLDEKAWHTAVLPETLGWDSHNYVTLAVDDDGRLHLSGNMHVAPLVYFRTREPLDIDTFERAPMVGAREDRVTYPHFFRGPGNGFLFTYRDGSSGDGDQIYNVYDHESRTWRRLLDTPLTDGQGLMNAYFSGPTKGPDGRYHLVWVWRDTPDCATNHDPCYARSGDLVHWETAAGKPLTLPITPETAEVVDPIPAGGGVINGNVKLGFDSQHRPVVSYHKYDANGNTQAYNARFQDGAWKVVQASDWDYRWAFSGGGAIPFEIRVSGVSVHRPGKLRQSYQHVKYGSGGWILDETTLEPVGRLEPPADDGREPEKPELDFEGIQLQKAGDSGASPEPGTHYVLRWETLGANRDRPREGPLPPPSMLRVLKFSR